MSNESVQVGFMMPAGSRDVAGRTTFVQDLEQALDLVSGTFDSAWCIDHMQAVEEDMLEAVSYLAYMAARFPRLKVGHAVLCQSFRNPAFVAKMGATLQFLSGGRYILGMGAGWDAEEHRAFGYEFPEGPERVERLDEAIQIVRAM